MENLTVETQVVKNYKFMNCSVMGDGVEKLNLVEGWLGCNWEGEVINYSKTCPHANFFAPSDKGGLSVFGLDKNGAVILGMAFYEGDKHSKDPVEQKPYFYCKSTKSTRCWSV